MEEREKEKEKKKKKKSLPFCDNNERNSISRVTREAKFERKKTCKKEKIKRTFGNRANNSSNVSRFCPRIREPTILYLACIYSYE